MKGLALGSILIPCLQVIEVNTELPCSLSMFPRLAT